MKINFKGKLIIIGILFFLSLFNLKSFAVEEDFISEDEVKDIYQANSELYDNNTENQFNTKVYSSTSSDEDVLDYIYAETIKGSTSVDIYKYSISTDYLSTIINKLSLDSRFFYIDSSFTYTYTSKNIVRKLNFNFTKTQDEINDGIKVIENVRDTFLGLVNDEWSDLEKVIFVNTFICDYCSYAEDTSDHDIYTLYGALVNKTPVCEGYALACEYLCNAMGVDSVVVTSTYMNHAWNLVKINGKYYHLDTTWNDSFGLVNSYYKFALYSDSGFQNMSSYAHTNYTPSNYATDNSMDNLSWKATRNHLVYHNNYWYYVLQNASSFDLLKVNLRNNSSNIYSVKTITPSENLGMEVGLTGDCKNLYFSTYHSIWKCDYLGTNIEKYLSLGNNVYLLGTHIDLDGMYYYSNSSASSCTSSSYTAVLYDGYEYEHDWNSEYIVKKEATCNQKGEKEITCKECNYSNVVEIPIDNNNHNWNTEYTIDKEATCSEKGQKSIHCSRCNVIKEDSILEIPNDSSIHTWNTEYTIDKEATCSEKGQKSIHCSKCDAIKEDSIIEISFDSSKHTWNNEYTIDKEATCSKKGQKSIHCSKCDVIKEDSTLEIPIDNNNHNWDEEYTIDKEATCKQEGSKSIHCIDCNAVKEGSSIVIPCDITKHNWNTNYTIDKKATCIEKGQKSIHCVDCNSVKSGSSVEIPIDSQNHNWNTEYTIDKEATCSEKGQESIHCKRCDIIKEDSILDLPRDTDNHNWDTEYTIDKKATCSEEGQKSIHCLDCNNIKEDSIVSLPIDTDNHNWDTEYTIDKEATCSEKGQKSIHCLDCNDIKEGSVLEISIDSNNHNWDTEYTIDKEASITEEGQKSIHCIDCDIINEESITIIPKNNIYNLNIVKKVIGNTNVISLGVGKSNFSITTILGSILNSDYKIFVYNTKNELVDNSAIIGSKYTLKIYDVNNNLIENSLIAIKGDVSGNGKVAIYDAFQILKGSLSNTKLDDIDTYIRDYNDDGKVAIYDAFQFLKQALK